MNYREIRNVWFYHPLPPTITSQAQSEEASHVLSADKLAYFLRSIQRILTTASKGKKLHSQAQGNSGTRELGHKGTVILLEAFILMWGETAIFIPSVPYIHNAQSQRKQF